MSIFNQMLNNQSNTAKITDKMIDIDNIIPYERNEEIYPTENDKERLEALIENIRENGLIQAIELRPIKNGMYESIGGNRRCEAIRHLVHVEKLEKFRYVKAVVKHMNDLEALEHCILSNDYREKTSYTKLKEIELLQKVLKEKEEKGEKVSGSTRSILARTTNLSETQVQRYQTIIKENNPEIIQAIKEDKISIKDAVKRIKIVTPKTNQYERIEKLLEDKLQTKTKISNNKLILHFVSDDDLNRLLEIMQLLEE